MPKESNQPIVALIACPEHRLPMTTIVETGPNISGADRELVSETLMCWRCRESDEDGILRLLQAIGAPLLRGCRSTDKPSAKSSKEPGRTAVSSNALTCLAAEDHAWHMEGHEKGRAH